MAPLNIQESPQFRKLANSMPQQGTAGVMAKKPSKARAKNANQGTKRVACSTALGESASKKISTKCPISVSGLQLLPVVNLDQTMTAQEEEEEAVYKILPTDFGDSVAIPRKSVPKEQEQQQQQQQQHEQINPVQYVGVNELLPYPQQQQSQQVLQEDNEDQQSQQILCDTRGLRTKSTLKNPTFQRMKAK
jgi:hypothetical protein